MTRLIPAVALVLLLPAGALAQSASELADPRGAMATAPVVVARAGAPGTRADVPTGVDPEIVALREDEPRPERASGASWRVQTPYREPARREGPDFGTTFAHSLGGFGLGIVGGAMTGSMMGCASLAVFGGCIIGLLYGAPAGAVFLSPFGAAFGAWGWGETTGGTGNFFASLGMAYLGAGIGGGAAALITHATQSGWGAVLGPVIGSVLTVFGATIGYQITSHGGADDVLRPPDTLVWTPTLAPTDRNDGATVGVAGVF